VSASWEKKGGRVAAVHWTRFEWNGTSFDFDAEDTTLPDDATDAHVTWTNMPEGYYSWTIELLDGKGSVLASQDQRPTTQYCAPLT
jgi:hypothetical protein